ncbi:M15 family metallopeptidase [Methylotuvimicrobium sp.]|uniref:M15 family metallopeptidase n=2 Tax=Methylotuvimicrobium sp. TaxID=2822413 RepID=UPI003D65DB22
MNIRKTGVLMLALLSLKTFNPAYAHAREDFVYVDTLIPSIRLDIRYASADNFIGRPIEGYYRPCALLTQAAAEALMAAQNELAKFYLGLKIFDAYRPQRAVRHFVRWSQDTDDVAMKDVYYPHLDKPSLIEEGYIAARSSHSRGSTVDLTLVDLDNGEELDMGGFFDYFGPESWSYAKTPTATQRAHRMLLQTVMEKQGFVHYPQEWWHFTLANEPYPDTYFDFPVQ